MEDGRRGRRTQVVQLRVGRESRGDFAIALTRNLRTVEQTAMAETWKKRNAILSLASL